MPQGASQQLADWAAAAPAAAPPRLRTLPATCLLLGPRTDPEILAAVGEALPDVELVTCGDAKRALAKAETAQRFGGARCLYLLDYRGAAATEFAVELRRIRDGDPEAEIAALIDGAGMELCRAALEVCPSSERLTFLLAPFWRPDMVATLRNLYDRAGLEGDRRRMEDSKAHVVRRLEAEVATLSTQLERATHAAEHDPLTGVLNRAGFVSELTQRLARNRRRQTLLLIDLDRFKLVNDTLGHHAGDDLVRKICAGMSSVVPTDGALARLGGDEFGVIVEGMGDQGVDELCREVLRVCGHTRRVLGHEVQITASIGVAAQGENPDEESLMRRADLALYAAKREGRNRFRRYDADLERETRRRLSIENGLEVALRTGQFRMAYQPIVTARTGVVAGFEALVRWDSPEHGPVSPAEFVPVAEETGLILDLGDWITRQAFRDCRRWGGPYVSVNLSARQFLRQNVAERILRYAEEADLAPSRIQVELTETAIIDDVERAAHNLEVLRHEGVRVALDDFGTGYSSLTYLNQFAIDCIKIDKSFVDNVARDRQSAIIVASVTRLASQLGMGVVAEGVETDQQQQVLTAAGCGALQGFRFGRPMSPREARALAAATLGGQ